MGAAFTLFEPAQVDMASGGRQSLIFTTSLNVPRWRDDRDMSTATKGETVRVRLPRLLHRLYTLLTIFLDL